MRQTLRIIKRKQSRFYQLTTISLSHEHRFCADSATSRNRSLSPQLEQEERRTFSPDNDNFVSETEFLRPQFRKVFKFSLNTECIWDPLQLTYVDHLNARMRLHLIPTDTYVIKHTHTHTLEHDTQSWMCFTHYPHLRIRILSLIKAREDVWMLTYYGSESSTGRVIKSCYESENCAEPD